jgi:CheY-like chemotaxis protein
MTNEGNPVRPGTRILLIDDNVDASLIVSMALRLQGFSVQSGDSGPQTLSIAEAWLPQAILLDISMPGMDGYETCRLLRQQPWGQAMVLIALTGYGQEEDRRRSKEAGFDWHLVKPVDLTSLPDLLTELIAQKRKI